MLPDICGREAYQASDGNFGISDTSCGLYNGGRSVKQVATMASEGLARRSRPVGLDLK
jgi:hypothetical protein